MGSYQVNFEVDEACLADRFHHLASSLADFVVMTWRYSSLSLSAHLCHTHVDIMFPTPSLTHPHTHTLRHLIPRTQTNTQPLPAYLSVSSHVGLSFDRVKLSGKWRGNDTGHIFTNLPCWHALLWHRACQQPVSSV